MSLGAVGDGRIVALIDDSGVLRWLCHPRFDGPSHYGSLLDPEGGHHGLAGARGIEQAYVPNTNVLRTLVALEGGHVAIFDHVVDGHLYRHVEIVEGHPTLDWEDQARPGYGRGGEDEDLVSVETYPERVAASIAADRAWVEGIDTPEVRSALALRLLQHHDGGIVAAATTSVPEARGEERNWDYRYVWVRDSCFVAEVLASIGAVDEARRLLEFFHRHAGSPIQPLYGLGGERSLKESVLEHWSGWEGNGPVRIGNAAAEQVQLDAPGQLLWLAQRLEWREDLDWLRAVASELQPWVPDNGIWEFRGEPAVHLHTQLWVGLGLRAAEHLLEEDRGAASHFERLLDRPWFPQSLEREVPDASSLLFGLLGVVAPDDERMVETLIRCEESLVIDGLMRRYVAEDDFGETTSTFSICTLWWIEALARMGQGARAAELLERLRSHANPLGLYSEDIDPSRGEQLGNFPQAYTHLALIRAQRAVDSTR